MLVVLVAALVAAPWPTLAAIAVLYSGVDPVQRAQLSPHQAAARSGNAAGRRAGVDQRTVTRAGTGSGSGRETSRPASSRMRGSAPAIDVTIVQTRHGKGSAEQQNGKQCSHHPAP